MQIANIQLALGGDKGNTIHKFHVTASEIAVLREIHGDEAVFDIEPQGEKKITHRGERERLLAIYGAAKKDDRPIVENLFPGAAARLFESLAELEIDESFFKATQRMSADDAGPTASGKPSWDAGLRKDGPTIEQWLDAGYTAEDYPPSGFEAKSTPEEVEAAAAAHKPAAPADENADDDDGIEDMNDGAAGGQQGSASGNVLG